jgi:C4-dicarboxylate transporter, DctM subunit
MDPFTLALSTLAFVVVFLGMGAWVFVGLMLVSVFSLYFLLDFPLIRIGSIVKGITWSSASNWALAAIPIFIMMGELIFRTDISDRLFRGLSPIVRRIPGGLIHTNIMGCTLFAAVSGSSTATTATVGRITVTELKARGYDTNLSIGSLAGAGSLGLLIPPSIVLIVYGILAETSVRDLFIAGVIPGLMIAALYSTYIGARCYLNPALTPTEAGAPTAAELGRALIDLMPVLSLILIVIGSIYSGIATPSEAAAVGLTATLAMIVVMGQFTWSMFIEALLSSVVTSAMVCSIVVSAALLSTTMGYLHVPQEIAAAIGTLNLSTVELILLIGAFYIVLGLFLDGISTLVMSLPITLPLILAAGYDPVWFGIFLVILIELSMITPPIGFNLFVLQALTGVSIGRVAYAALPFFFLMLFAAVIITVFPDIVLYLPNLVRPESP